MAAARRALLDVGDVVRPHGLRGQVVVRLTTDQPDRLDCGAVLSTDLGELRVAESRPLKDRFVVAFEGIATVEAAEALRGVVLRAVPLERDGVLWVDELVGVEVRTTSGRVLGVVEAVEANPASDLLVLDTATLVPVRFIVGDIRDGTVTVDVPEGLV